MAKIHTPAKFIVLALTALAILAFALIILTSCTPSQTTEQSIRILIRANSDVQKDRDIDLKVCVAVEAYLKKSLANCKTKSDAWDKLRADKDIILSLAVATLRSEGVDYSATIRLDNEYFSQRTYDGRVFPDGDYDVILLELGNGAGQYNSGVAYPIVSFTSDDEKVVYKSWIKETIDKLFN